MFQRQVSPHTHGWPNPAAGEYWSQTRARPGQRGQQVTLSSPHSQGPGSARWNPVEAASGFVARPTVSLLEPLTPEGKGSCDPVPSSPARPPQGRGKEGGREEKRSGHPPTSSEHMAGQASARTPSSRPCLPASKLGPRRSWAYESYSPRRSKNMTARVGAGLMNLT